MKSSKKMFANSVKLAYERYSDIIGRILKSEYKVEKLITLPKVKIVKKDKSKEKPAVKKVAPKKKPVPSTKANKASKEKPKEYKPKSEKKVITKKTKTKKKAKPWF